MGNIHNYASNIEYDNTKTGLQSETVQDAVDEISSSVFSCTSKFESINKDTLMWDGNTDGLEADVGDGSWYRISDVVPTIEDLQNGGTFAYGDDIYTFDSTNIYSVEDGLYGVSMYNDNHVHAGVVIVSEEGIGKSFDPQMYLFEAEKTGVYLHLGITAPQKFTINTYSGFAGEEKLKENTFQIASLS